MRVSRNACRQKYWHVHLFHRLACALSDTGYKAPYARCHFPRTLGCPTRSPTRRQHGETVLSINSKCSNRDRRDSPFTR